MLNVNPHNLYFRYNLKTRNLAFNFTQVLVLIMHNEDDLECYYYVYYCFMLVLLMS